MNDIIRVILEVMMVTIFIMAYRKVISLGRRLNTNKCEKQYLVHVIDCGAYCVMYGFILLTIKMIVMM